MQIFLSASSLLLLYFILPFLLDGTFIVTRGMVESIIVNDVSFVAKVRRLDGGLVFMGGMVGGNVGDDIDVVTVVEVRRLEDEYVDEDDVSV